MILQSETGVSSSALLKKRDSDEFATPPSLSLLKAEKAVVAALPSAYTAGTPVAALLNAADADNFHQGPYQQA